MRTISEKTILTALVNLKCVGYFGKTIKSLTKQERNFVIDTLINRGWINEQMQVQPSAKEVILSNLTLCQYK